MGRWASCLLRGQNNIGVRIVSVYHSRKPQEYGCCKAYIQQQAALLKLRIDKTPEQVFWEDLWACIDKWIGNSEQLIVCRDWNQDVRNAFLQDQFAQRNMVSTLMSRHDASTAPETYNGGSELIDEIFASISLAVTAGGFLEHGSSLADHRPIWIDVHKESALGTVYPDIPSHRARRLKCSDPWVVKNYTKRLDQFYTDNNLYDRIQQLSANFSTPLTPEQQMEYEKIEELRVEGMFLAERRCRKSKMGHRKWSPQFTQTRKVVKYIKTMISRLRGKHVNTKYLYRLSKQLGFSTEGVSEDDLIVQLIKAKKQYNKLKDNHNTNRLTFLEDLAQALEDHGQGKQSSNF